MILLMDLTVDMIIEELSYMIQRSNADCAGICVRILLLIVYLLNLLGLEVVRVSLMTRQS